MKTIPILYQNSLIDFVHSENDIMVNATQMAKIFGKQVNEFVSNQNTQNFIKECLKNGNSRFLNINNESDLIDSRQKSGTYMHRILALKFAAWLDPHFELWVFSTIDKILMEHYATHRSVSISAANLRKTIADKEKALRNNPAYLELEKLHSDYRNLISLKRTTIKQATQQIELEILN